MQELKTIASLHGHELKQNENVNEKGRQQTLSKNEEAAITAAFNQRMKGQ